MKFIDEHGLINSRPDERNAENAFLWSVQHYFLQKELGTLSEAHISILRASLDKMRLGPGLYAQNPLYAVSEPQNAHDAYMSRDQLMAICAISADQGWDDAKEIWKEIKKQKLRYDNVNPDKPRRFFWPWDLAFVGACAGSKVCSLLLFLVYFSCLISCKSDPGRTSGKLLTFVRCQALKDKHFVMRMCWKKCTKLIQKQYGTWAGPFRVYFKYLNHPVRLLAEKLYG